jgi:hypothetical protein
VVASWQRQAKLAKSNYPLSNEVNRNHQSQLNLFDELLSGHKPVYLSRAPAPPSQPQSILDNEQHIVETPSNNQILPATYKLSRGLDTVADVWQEYTVGIDGPAVEQLDVQFGAKWRSAATERKFYSRRSRIYNKLRELMHSGMSESDAVKFLDDIRKAKLNTLQNKMQEIGTQQQI